MSTKQIYLVELIDRASKVAGSDAALARHLEQNRQAVSDWRHGRARCTPGDVALMAELAGLDAEAWAARAIISQYEGTSKGAKLEEALKKALLATGGAIVSSGVHAAPVISAARDWLEYFIRCINSKEGNYQKWLADRCFLITGK